MLFRDIFGYNPLRMAPVHTNVTFTYYYLFSIAIKLGEATGTRLLASLSLHRWSLDHIPPLRSGAGKLRPATVWSPARGLVSATYIVVRPAVPSEIENNVLQKVSVESIHWLIQRRAFGANRKCPSRSVWNRRKFAHVLKYKEIWATLWRQVCFKTFNDAQESKIRQVFRRRPNLFGGYAPRCVRNRISGSDSESIDAMFLIT